MTYLRLVGNFLKGTYARFGSTANLMRELSLSVITAVGVAIGVQLLAPAAPDPITGVLDLVNQSVARQREVDSLRFEKQTEAMRTELDSLRRLHGGGEH